MSFKLKYFQILFYLNFLSFQVSISFYIEFNFYCKSNFPLQFRSEGGDCTVGNLHCQETTVCAGVSEYEITLETSCSISVLQSHTAPACSGQIGSVLSAPRRGTPPNIQHFRPHKITVLARPTNVYL